MGWDREVWAGVTSTPSTEVQISARSVGGQSGGLLGTFGDKDARPGRYTFLFAGSRSRVLLRTNITREKDQYNARLSKSRNNSYKDWVH